MIPPRAAAQIAERAGLAAWAPPPPTVTATSDTPLTTDNTETRRLLHLLLTIYTVDTTYASHLPLPNPSIYISSHARFRSHVSTPSTPSDAHPPPHPPTSVAQSPSPPQSPPKDTEAAAAHLLASHATSFDPQTVLSTLPSRWPLRTLSLYLVRTLRTAANTSRERAIVKALATGQNLAVTDAAHEQLRAAGALIEEALDEEDNDVSAGVSGEEEVVFNEKTVLPDAPASIAVDLPLRGKRERVGEDASVDAVGAGGSWMSGWSSVTHADDRD